MSKAKVDIVYKKGSFVSLDFIVMSYTSEKVSGMKIEALKKRLRKKFEPYIAYDRECPELLPQEGIKDHYYANPRDIEQWLSDVNFNDSFKDKEYYENARLEYEMRLKLNKQEAVDNTKVVEIPYDGKLGYSTDKDGKVKAYKLDGIDWELPVFDKETFVFYGARDGTYKGGTLKNSTKIYVLQEMKRKVIEKNNVNKELALAIIEEELKKAGFNTSQMSFF